VKLQLDMDYDWAPVTCADGSPYTYPEPVRNVRNSFHGPAVYRWRFMDGDRLAAIYIGECDDLVKHISASANPVPAQKSASRIKGALGERMLMGEAGCLDTLVIRSASLGSTMLGPEFLRDKHARRAVESLLIHDACKQDIELLNQETSARDLLSLL
jgi:hypothetical protein